MTIIFCTPASVNIWRAPSNTTALPGADISRGFTVLNQLARAGARHPRIRQILISGPLEYILDAPKARALALQRLSPAAQGYLESLCE